MESVKESKLREILFDGDEIVKVEGTIDLSKYRFKRKKLSIDEMLNLLKNYPSLGFNAYQRLYAAVKMFGRIGDRWRILDYPIINPYVDKTKVGALYGIEKEFDSIVNYLKGASEGRHEKRKLLALFGDVGSGKTNTVNLLSEALSAYGTFPEGEVYTVVFDLNEFQKSIKDESLREDIGKFINEKIPGDVRVIQCPAHENPLSTLLTLSMEEIIDEDINEIIQEINSNEKYEWKKLNVVSTPCPHCSFVIELFGEILEENRDNIERISEIKEAIRKSISFINLKTYGVNPEVTTVEFRIPDKRSEVRTIAFEGSFSLERVGKLGSKEHPLVINLGLAGEIDKPSCQRGILHLTELLKSDEDMIKQLLDFVEDHVIRIGNRNLSAYLDTVMISTSNLDELMKIREKITKTIEDRMYKVVYPHPAIIDDVEKALKERIFVGETYHIPPHFLRLLSIIFVLSTLEEPTEIKIGSKSVKMSLIEKALLYNGEVPLGMEGDAAILVQELRRIAENKDIRERKEGLVGISMRLMQDLASYLRGEVEKVCRKNSEKGYKHCVAILENEYPDGIKGFLADFFNTNLGKEEDRDTRNRIIQDILPVVFEPNEKYGLYLSHLASDVRRAIVGDEKIIEVAITYISMIMAAVKKDSVFVHPIRGTQHVVDEKFMESIEKYMGVSSSYRENFVAKFNYQLRAMKKLYGTEKEAMLNFIKDFLEEEKNFRKAIEEYTVRQYISEIARDISSVYNPRNEELVGKLVKEFGYCNECAQYAINIASKLRPK
ncbi:MAG: hypothetical protein QXE42_02080 [Candidatus Aenigmatarchaeota archaeon]